MGHLAGPSVASCVKCCTLTLAQLIVFICFCYLILDKYMRLIMHGAILGFNNVILKNPGITKWKKIRCLSFEQDPFYWQV